METINVPGLTQNSTTIFRSRFTIECHNFYLQWAIPFFICTPPPIEVLYISPPQESKLLTPQEKEDQIADTLPLQDLFKDQRCRHTKDPPPPWISLNLNRGGGVCRY